MSSILGEGNFNGKQVFIQLYLNN